MGKRRLTDRQRRHIQEKRLARAGTELSTQEEDSLGAEQEGLVVTRFGNTVDVEDGDGRVVRCKLRKNIGELVCGDKVIWQAESDSAGIINAVYIFNIGYVAFLVIN